MTRLSGAGKLGSSGFEVTAREGRPPPCVRVESQIGKTQEPSVPKV